MTPILSARQFGENLRQARERAGLSQATVAAEVTRLLGCTVFQQTIARLEAGLQRVRLDEALALARVAGASIDELTTPAEPVSKPSGLTLSVGAFLQASA